MQYNEVIKHMAFRIKQAQVQTLACHIQAR